MEGWGIRWRPASAGSSPIHGKPASERTPQSACLRAHRNRGAELKADPSAQLRLLDVQELDARADQLRHRLASLPEHADIAAARAQVQDLDNLALDARTRVEDLTAEQEKADADVEVVKARRTRDRDRMDKGLITNPKDLERMQQELISLERRIGTLEDEEIEVMEQLEEAQRELADFTEQSQAAREKGAALVASRDAKTAEIEAELATISADRGPAAEGLPADLVTLYDKLRASKDGVGAAALRARECGGCRLSLDAGELASIKAAPEDDVIRCAECQRILVRTPESGL